MICLEKKNLVQLESRISIKRYLLKKYKAKTIEHYEKFLDLWKDADSGIAEVEVVRKRLAGLKSQ